MRGLWCIAILAIGVAQGQERQPGQGVNFYSKEKEVALGRHLAEEFRKNSTSLGNAAVNDYLKRVGANLAAQLPGDWTYQIEAIRDDPGGPTHEPTAFPGGFLFVSAGLISAAQNEAEFAGMLAHAMAHVAARHGTRLATKAELTQIGTLVSSANLANHSGGSPVPMGIVAMQRANEREADYLAVQSMAAAGYDPAGLASYVERLQPRPPAAGGALETLPARDERVAAIQAEIRKLPARTYQADDEFARLQAQVKLP